MNGYKNYVPANVNNYNEYDYVSKLLTISGEYIVGPAGPPGPPGISPTLAVGNTYTTSPGTNANVIDTISGTTHTLTFYIPEGQKGDTGSKGEKGDTGASTLEAELAAAEASASAASASTSAATCAGLVAQCAGYAEACEASVAECQAIADSINTEFEGRVAALETKTEFQDAHTDTSGNKITEFNGQVKINNADGYHKIILNGDSQQISVGSSSMASNTVTSQNIYVKNIDAPDSFTDINIGRYSNMNVNIGNPMTTGTLLQSDINFYGRINFGFNSIIGTIQQF